MEDARRINDKTNSAVSLTQIPAELRNRRQWLVWKEEGGTKVPYKSKGLRGRPNRPSDWIDFESACALAESEPFDGIAFVFSADDPFCGIDLDACREPVTGVLRPWARSKVEEIRSYSEVSPSGTGVKIICRAKKPLGARCIYPINEAAIGSKSAQVEIYDERRFWAITAEVLPGFESIRESQVEIESLVARLSAAKSADQQSVSGVNHSETAVSTAAKRYVDAVPNVPVGQRNCAAFKLAGHLAAMKSENGERLPESEIVRLVSEWNRGNAEPLPVKEIAGIVHSARTNGTPRPTKLIKYGNSELIPAAPRSEGTVATGDNFDLRYDPARTDTANAQRFVDRYSREVRFVPAWKKWLAWDGRRWADDNGTGVLRCAVDYAESLWPEFGCLARSDVNRDVLSKFRSFIKHSNSRSGIKDFIALAQADERVVCPVERLNARPELLNVRNGTIDLATGELRSHSPDDLLTQLADVDYDPTADCPNWKAALDLIFGNDQELILFLQQALGYSISGLSTEHLLMICWGTGCNGKSTIWNVMAKILGDYATIASQDLLLPVKSQHPTERAALYQKRFVAISEPSQGRAIDEAKAKELTGGDQITARRMGEDFWTFTPTHTLWMATNHKPRIRGTDSGIWRRIRLVPFTVDLRNVITPKPGFADWLVENEGPGILAWLVRGFRDWKNHGLGEPDAVKTATSDYRQTEDEIGNFIGEHCDLGDELSECADSLYSAYQKTGGQLSQRSFGESLSSRFRKDRPSSGPNRKRTVYYGLALQSPI